MELNLMQDEHGFYTDSASLADCLGLRYVKPVRNSEPSYTISINLWAKLMTELSKIDLHAKNIEDTRTIIITESGVQYGYTEEYTQLCKQMSMVQ